MRLITVNHCQLHMTVMTSKRSLIQRSRSQIDSDDTEKVIGSEVKQGQPMITDRDDK